MTPFRPALDRDLWERQPHETDHAYRAYKTYEQMGVGRSYPKVAAELGMSAEGKKIDKWGSRFGWRLRATHWDKEIDKRERMAALNEAEKKSREHMNVANLMVGVSAKALYLWDKMLTHDMATRKREEDAATAAGVEPPPPRRPSVTPSEARAMAEAGLKLAQLLEGRPTEIHDHRDSIGVDERRKAIQAMAGDPKLRAAVEAVETALTESTESDTLAAEELH